jgi:hypothetical protein
MIYLVPEIQIMHRKHHGQVVTDLKVTETDRIVETVAAASASTLTGKGRDLVHPIGIARVRISQEDNYFLTSGGMFVYIIVLYKFLISWLNESK